MSVRFGRGVLSHLRGDPPEGPALSLAPVCDAAQGCCGTLELLITRGGFTPTEGPLEGETEERVADKITKDSRQLVVEISDAEAAQRGRELAEVSARLAQEEEARATSIRRHKNTISGLKERINDLVDAVNSKSERREIACTWKFDYHGKVATLYRDDLKTEVETRPLTFEELQTVVKGAFTKAEVDENESDNRMPKTARRKKAPGKNNG